MAGEDIVVCGDDMAANRQLALQIEQAVGLWLRQLPILFSDGTEIDIETSEVQITSVDTLYAPTLAQQIPA